MLLAIHLELLVVDLIVAGVRTLQDQLAGVLLLGLLLVPEMRFHDEVLPVARLVVPVVARLKLGCKM